MRASAPDRPITPRERSGLAALILACALIALACQSGCDIAPDPAASAQLSGAVSKEPGTTTPASDVFRAQLGILRAMAKDYPGVAVKVIWKPCGEENSYYYGGADPHIVLCTEMEAHPDAAVFFAAHEMGHAVTDKLASTTDEHAADEVGALAMLRHGMIEQLMGASIFWASQPELRHHHGDEHPSNGFRAWELMCLADGSEARPASDDCAALYRAVTMLWAARLTDPQVPDDEEALDAMTILTHLFD